MFFVCKWHLLSPAIVTFVSCCLSRDLVELPLVLAPLGLTLYFRRCSAHASEVLHDDVP